MIVAGLLVMNLCLAGSEVPFIGSMSRTARSQGEAMNLVVNFVPLAFLFWWSRGWPKAQIVSGALLALIGVDYLLSTVANAVEGTRYMACTFFVVLTMLTLSRGGFIAQVTTHLARIAPHVTLLFAGIVTALNVGRLSLTFYYPKSVTPDAMVHLPFVNPNLLCVQLDIVVALVVVMLILMPTPRRGLVGVACLVWLSNLVLATRSRGGIMELGAMWIIAAFWLKNMFPRRFRALVMLAAVGIASLISWGSLYGAVSERLTEQYQLRRALESRSVTADAILQILENPKTMFFGNGAGNGGFQAKYTFDSLKTFSSHNSLVDTVAQFGIPFLILLAAAIGAGWWSARTRILRERWRLYLFLVWCALMVHPMSEAVFFFRFGVTPDVVRFGVFALALWRPPRSSQFGSQVIN